MGPEEEPVDGPTEDGVPEEDTAAAGGEAASGGACRRNRWTPEGLEGPLPERLEESVTEEGSLRSQRRGDTPESDPPGTDVPHRDEGATEATAGGLTKETEAVGRLRKNHPPARSSGPDGELTNEPGPEPRPEREPEREPASTRGWPSLVRPMIDTRGPTLQLRRPSEYTRAWTQPALAFSIPG